MNAGRIVEDTISEEGDWIARFKKHAENGGHAVLRIDMQEKEDGVRVLSCGMLGNVPMGSIVVAHGVEPTVWAVCEDVSDLRAVAREMVARRTGLQTTLHLYIVRPQDGARATYGLPMRHDIHETIKTAVDMPGTIQAQLFRIQAQLFRHQDAIIERLGGNLSSCVYCGDCTTVGANEVRLQLRVVADEVPFANVTVHRKCNACSDATATAAVIVATTEGAPERVLEAFDDHQLASIRIRAAVRNATHRRNPGALVAALEEALDRLTDDMHMDLAYAAHALVALVAEAPHVSRRARAVLRCVPTWPCIVEDDLRLCAACDVSKPCTDYSANQWRKGRRRCRECQAGGVARDARKLCVGAEEHVDADALAVAFDALALRERARLSEELARRNAHEHRDDDCVICFQMTPEDDPVWRYKKP